MSEEKTLLFALFEEFLRFGPIWGPDPIQVWFDHYLEVPFSEKVQWPTVAALWVSMHYLKPVFDPSHKLEGKTHSYREEDCPVRRAATFQFETG